MVGPGLLLQRPGLLAGPIGLFLRRAALTNPDSWEGEKKYTTLEVQRTKGMEALCFLCVFCAIFAVRAQTPYYFEDPAFYDAGQSYGNCGACSGVNKCAFTSWSGCDCPLGCGDSDGQKTQCLIEGWWKYDAGHDCNYYVCNGKASNHKYGHPCSLYNHQICHSNGACDQNTKCNGENLSWYNHALCPGRVCLGDASPKCYYLCNKIFSSASENHPGCNPAVAKWCRVPTTGYSRGLESYCDHKCFGLWSDAASVCSGHGTCSGEDLCACYVGYSGASCDSWTCGGVARDSPDACSGRGECVALDECACFDWYYGDNCEMTYCFGVPMDSPSACSGYGECVGLNLCVCDEGHYGEACGNWECFGVNMTDPSVCSGRGVCASLDVCECSDGYYGEECQLEYVCYGENASSAEACSGHGTCVGADSCACDALHVGERCGVPVCSGLPATDPLACSGNGDCVDGAFVPECACHDGYSGELCDRWACYGHWMDSPDACGGRGTCMAPNNCTCEPHYWGSECGAWECYGFPMDSEGACSGFGECIAHDSCVCSDGYFGDSCGEYSTLTMGLVWVWVSGSSYSNENPSYGTRGVFDVSNTPGGRYGHSSVASEGSMFTFAGIVYVASSSGYLSDVWEFNLTSWEWRWVAGPSSVSQYGVYGVRGVFDVSNTPGARYLHSSEASEGSMIAFGGSGHGASSFGGLSDVWEFSLTSWEWRWIAGSSSVNQKGVYGTRGAFGALNAPGGRYGHSFVASEGSMIAFGGNGYGASSQGGLSDVWEFSLASWEWRWVAGPPSVDQNGLYGARGVFDALNTPGGRYGHSSVLRQGSMIAFGGFGRGASSIGRLSDVWEFNLTSWEWRWIAGPSSVNQNGVYGAKGVFDALNTPGGRYGHSSVASEGSMIAFGGSGYDASLSGLLSDVWEFNLTSWEWKWVAGPPSVDQNGLYGARGVFDAFTSPGSRSHHTSVLDGETMYIYGGEGYSVDGTGVLSDVWLFGTFYYACFGVTGRAGCSGHGECVYTDVCHCDNYWTGADCALVHTCNGIEANDPAVCSGHGDCVGEDECRCDVGFLGSGCAYANESHAFLPQCQGIYAHNYSYVCSGHGYCLFEDYCDCHYGWGTRAAPCDTPVCDPPCARGACEMPNVCACDAGWSGRLCDTPECDPPCNDHSACANVSGESACVCEEGWSGLECADPVCGGCSGELEECAAPGDCRCVWGYYRVGAACAPICTRCDPWNSTCVAPGECACDEEFADALGDGSECVPGCACPEGERCTRWMGCECIDGYARVNGTCAPDCEGGCGPHEVCVAHAVCACADGYGRDDGACHPVCKPYECAASEYCCAPDECCCREGYYRDAGACVPHCDPPCGDRMECAAPNACACSAGWAGTNCSEPVCDPPCRYGREYCKVPWACACLPGWEGEECSTPVCELCEPMDHKECLEPGVCRCASGYHERYLGAAYFACDPIHVCFGAPSYDPTACGGHGDCVMTDECACDLGYKRTNWGGCAKAQCLGVDWDDPAVCSGSGDCSPVGETCSCDYGWSGLDCSAAVCYGSTASDEAVCSGHGECFLPNYCVCDERWAGEECAEPTCIPGCALNELCQVVGGEPACVAVQQYTCNGIEANETGVCSGHGECMNMDRCCCESRYSGLWCDVWFCNGERMDSNATCGGHGECVAPDVCACDDGYQSEFCNIWKCYGHPQVSAVVCSRNGECVAPDECACFDGYYGDDCSGVECFGVPGDSEAVCNGHGKCAAPNACVCAKWYSDLGNGTCVSVSRIAEGSCFGVSVGSPDVCSGHGVCSGYDACACSVGWSGIDCLSESELNAEVAQILDSVLTALSIIAPFGVLAMVVLLCAVACCLVWTARHPHRQFVSTDSQKLIELK